MGSRPRDGDDTRPAATGAVGKNLHAGSTCVPNRLFRPRSSPTARRLAVNKHKTPYKRRRTDIVIIYLSIINIYINVRMCS